MPRAKSQQQMLCLCRRLLLLRDRSLARPLAGTSIRVCALAPDRQVAAVAESAIGADFDETLDVHRNFLAQIALDQSFGFDDRTDAVDFFFAQVLHLLHRVDLGLVAEATGARMTDAVDVRQRDVDMLLARKIDACNTCHVFLTSAAVPQPQSFWLLALSSWLLAMSQKPKAKSFLALALFMFRVDANHPHHTLAVDDLALVANLLYRCSYFHNCSQSLSMLALSMWGRALLPVRRAQFGAFLLFIPIHNPSAIQVVG